MIAKTLVRDDFPDDLRSEDATKRCSVCGENLPLYRFKRGSAGESPVCLSCMSPSGKSRADSWRSLGLKTPSRIRGDAVLFEAPLTPELKKKLDDYVKGVIGAGGYASITPNHRLVRELSPDKIRDALMIYADVSREWCVVESVKHGAYHFMSYRNEDEPANYRLFDPTDFAAIDRYIDAREPMGEPVAVNARLVGLNSPLGTRGEKQWLLLRSYFGLRPDRKILWRGALVDCDQHYLDTYLVGKSDDEALPPRNGKTLALKLYRDELRAQG